MFSTLTCTTVHWCEFSLKSSSRYATIWAEVEPQRWPCWNYSAMSHQVSSEGHQQWTWGGEAVVNPQVVVATFCAEVGKLHFDKEAVWYGDAPATVLAVGVVVRVVRACKSARVFPTDGGRAPWTNRYRGLNHYIYLRALYPFCAQLRCCHSNEDDHLQLPRSWSEECGQFRGFAKSPLHNDPDIAPRCPPSCSPSLPSLPFTQTKFSGSELEHIDAKLDEVNQQIYIFFQSKQRK